MTIDFKTAMGLLAVVIMLAAYGVNLWKTYIGKSEPHPIAWIGFGLLTGIGFVIQWQKGAGAGGWVMGLTAIFCIFIAAMSQYKRRWHLSDFDREDWSSFAGGIVVFAIYLLSLRLSWGALISASLATLADLWLYVPILKKVWSYPETENATAYFLNSLKFVPALFAMDAYSVETCLYPSALIVANAFTAAYAILRRKWLSVIPDDFAIVMLRLLDATLPVLTVLVGWALFPAISARKSNPFEFCFCIFVSMMFVYMIMAGLLAELGKSNERKSFMSLRASQWLMGIQISNTRAVAIISGGMAGIMFTFLVRDMTRSFMGLPSSMDGLRIGQTLLAYTIGAVGATILYLRNKERRYNHLSKFVLPLTMPIWLYVEAHFGRGAGAAILFGSAFVQFTWTVWVRPYEQVPVEASARWIEPEREYAFFPH